MSQCRQRLCRKSRPQCLISIGGEDRVFTEWKIGYTVDGEKYTQIVTDNGYEKGDMIDIKYNPANPQEFYLDDEKSR